MQPHIQFQTCSHSGQNKVFFLFQLFLPDNQKLLVLHCIHGLTVWKSRCLGVLVGWRIGLVSLSGFIVLLHHRIFQFLTGNIYPLEQVAFMSGRYHYHHGVMLLCQGWLEVSLSERLVYLAYHTLSNIMKFFITVQRNCRTSCMGFTQ